MIRFKNKEHLKVLIFFSNLIRIIFRGDRTTKISKKIEFILKKKICIKKKKITIIDFGCGSMEISKKIQHLSYIKKIIGLDIFKFTYVYKKLNYQYYNNLNDLKKYRADVMIVIDVIHHIGVKNSNKLLKILSNSSKILIIKDHFEHGFISRHFLRFVDFYANYAYGVKIPKIYFTEKTWKKNVNLSKLKEIYFEKNFQQHTGFFNILLHPKHHFFSVLKKEK